MEYHNEHNQMNPQDGTNSSLYGACITIVLAVASNLTLNMWVGIFAIVAASTTIAVNLKNFFKKR